MRHLLLIDNSIKDLAVFQAAINTNTDSIVFDFATETLATLQTKLSAFGRRRIQFEHVGIVQENGPANDFLKLVENQDFVQWIVDKTKCVALDLFICNIIKDPRWKNTLQMIKTSFPQIDLGASNNVTGNNTSDGDWIAETNGVNLKTVYLTDAIKDYKGTFGVNSDHSIIVDGSGGCYVMGDNYDGQLGLGIGKSFYSISPPERLTIPGKSITDVQLGDLYSVFLCSDGTVYSCGDNGNGQLGLGNTNNYYTPTQIDISNVSVIACGRDHTLFLCSNGTVYGCGDNYEGQLGLDDNDDRYAPTQIPNLSNVLKIAAGANFSMFLLNNGSLYGTGLNDDGQLGIGNNDSQTTPQLVISTNFSSSITAIACGRYHTLFLCSDGTVYGAGRNSGGDIGLDSTSDYDTPTQIDPNYFSDSGVGMIFCGYRNSFFVCMNGNVYGTGDNGDGELGINTISTEYTPVEITFFSDNKTVNYIAAHDTYTLFVCSDRNVYSCGDNNDGKLGDGSIELLLQPTLYSFSKTITSFAGSNNHSLFLCSDGSVYSCGYGGNGALGLGDYLDVSALTQITYFTDISKNVSKIASNISTDTSIFLCSDGTVYGCGYNYYGQLGLGNTSNQNIPTQIMDLSSIIITDIACGEDNSFFLDSNGNAYGCGYNYFGQLGINNYSDQNVPIQITDLSNISMIGAGGYHTIFISNGNAYGCGYNNSGQLGLGYTGGSVSVPTLITDVSNVTSADGGWYHSIISCSDGTVYGAGSNGDGELGLGNTVNQTVFTQITDLSNISAISSSTYHSTFLDGSGNVYGCGSNSNAQLGLLKTEEQITNNNCVLTPTQIIVGSNKTVSTIFTSYYQCAFICDDNTFYVCGQNWEGTYNKLGLKYVDQYELPTLATFQATIDANLVVCFGEGTEILTLDGDNEKYVKVEKLRPGAIIKTYQHGPQVIKKIGTGTLINNSDDPKKCMFKMEKQGNMTADLCLTGGHAILRDYAPKGLQFKIDDKYLHFVENLPEFKKMEARRYNYYNFCFENGGNKDLRFGVWANGVLCETPSEKQFDSFEVNMLV